LIFVLAFLAIFAAFWIVVALTGPAFERMLAHAANYTARFRYRDYVPVFVLLAAGAGAAAAAGNAFVELAEALQSQSAEMQSVDTAVHAWARETRTDGSTRFFTILTIIGTPIGLALITSAVAVVLFVQNRWRWAGYLLITSITGGLLNLQLKSYFARARPELAEALRDAHGYSFPSGHAMGSAVVFGALAYLAFRVVNAWRPRAAMIAFCFAMIVAISASRIYLGVHWISDVAAGIAAGLIWVVATTVAYETFRRIRLVRSLRKKADAKAE
jgi:membrane-associated phospholipid phosphatase